MIIPKLTLYLTANLFGGEGVSHRQFTYLLKRIKLQYKYICFYWV